MIGYVYVVMAGQRFKVGFTTRLRERLAELRTANADLRLVALCPGDEDVEKLAHAVLAPWHVTHEWFDATEQSLVVLSFHFVLAPDLIRLFDPTVDLLLAFGNSPRTIPLSPLYRYVGYTDAAIQSDAPHPSRRRKTLHLTNPSGRPAKMISRNEAAQILGVWPVELLNAEHDAEVGDNVEHELVALAIAGHSGGRYALHAVLDTLSRRALGPSGTQCKVGIEDHPARVDAMARGVTAASGSRRPAPPSCP